MLSIGYRFIRISLLHFNCMYLLIVICYLATFQLEELGLQHFSRIVKSLDTAKMRKVTKVQNILKNN